MLDDPLSDVLRAIRLTGAVFLDNHLTAPWCVQSAVTPEDCAPFQLRPKQLIAFHLIVEGTAQVALEGQKPLAVAAGDVVVFPRNDTHLIGSDTGIKAVKCDDYILPATPDRLALLRLGGGGALTRLYCGFLASPDRTNPVIAALPPMIKLDMKEYEAFDWMESSMRFAIQELMQGRLASSDMMSRIAELLFVEAVRRHVAGKTEDYGWLNGFRDVQIGKALQALHRDLKRSWSVAALAREAGMSRTAFSGRFASVVGQSPIRYLAAWRLRTAQAHLRDGDETLARIADAVGYESEEAFSRAFKREYGMAPALWRREN